MNITTFADLVSIVTRLACWALSVMIAVIVIFIIIAGIRFMLAGGSSERFSSAKTNFKLVLIGALVIIGVYVIIITVANAVGVAVPGTFPFSCPKFGS